MAWPTQMVSSTPSSTSLLGLCDYGRISSLTCREQNGLELGVPGKHLPGALPATSKRDCVRTKVPCGFSSLAGHQDENHPLAIPRAKQ